MRSFSFFKISLMVISFSLIIVSCGGEEPNLPDDESVVDETTDESPDEIVVENTDEAEDTVSIDEDATETEADEDVDDQEIVYKEIDSLDECLDSPCKNLCFLQWDEESGERVYLYELYDNNEVSNQYIMITLEVTSDKRCYVNSEDLNVIIGATWDRKEFYELPFEIMVENFDMISFVLDTGETWQEKKKLTYETYDLCYQDDKDWCEYFGKEKVEIEGEEYMLGADAFFIPLTK